MHLMKITSTPTLLILFSITFAICFKPLLAQEKTAGSEDVKKKNSIQALDLTNQTHRQIIVDREEGQYLGHPTTCLLEDGKTMLCVYPKGHGRGAIVYKRSTDGGLTWSERLPTPEELGYQQGSPYSAPGRGCRGEKTDHHVVRSVSRAARGNRR